jgi:hypothetical protein
MFYTYLMGAGPNKQPLRFTVSAVMVTVVGRRLIRGDIIGELSL